MRFLIYLFVFVAGGTAQNSARISPIVLFPPALAAEPQALKRLDVVAAFEHIPDGGRSAEDWDAWMKRAADFGYTDFFAELAYGGYAHYPSEHYEESAGSRRHGDQISAFATAAWAADVAPHVVKVVFNVEYGRTSRFLDAMRREGRLMKQWNFDKQRLEEKLWLAPSHPANQALIKNIIMEIVRRYEIAGINLDYIRYPSDTTDFSSISRTNFERYLGRLVERWPEDVLPHWRKKGDPTGSLYETFKTWQASVITTFLTDVYRSIKAIDPDLILSASVFADPKMALGHGQDWATWAKASIIDALYPMNYSMEFEKFKKWLDEQASFRRMVKIYPAVRIDRDNTTENRLILAKQIEMILEASFSGMMIWQYKEQLLPTNPESCEGMVPNFASRCRAGILGGDVAR